MRSTSVHVIFLLAACSASSRGSADDSVETIPLTCSGSVDDYCATNPCDRDLATATQDTMLCPASLIRCGDYDVILQGGVDTSTNYYYQDGQLVAIVRLVLPGRYTCLGGPVMFNATQCVTTHEPLPACMSSSRSR